MFPEARPAAGPRRMPPSIAWGAGCASLAVAAMLVFDHGAAVRDLQQRTLPAALKLPALEDRLAMLRQQAEVADLHAALQTASVDEWIRIAVVPQNADMAPFIGALQILEDAGRAAGTIRTIGPIDVGTTATSAEDLSVTPVTIRFTGTAQGADDVLTFLDTAGLLTVGDVLTSDERSLLVQLADGENPASVAALEQFFAADLLTYALDAQSIERQLLRAFASPLMERAITNVANTSKLRDVRRVLGGATGEAMHKGDQWPLRFLIVRSWDEQRLGDGSVQVTVAVDAYGRKGSND